MCGAECGEDVRVLRFQLRGTVEDDERFVPTLHVDQRPPDTNHRFDVVRRFEHGGAVHGSGEIGFTHLLVQAPNPEPCREITRVRGGAALERRQCCFAITLLRHCFRFCLRGKRCTLFAGRRAGQHHCQEESAEHPITSIGNSVPAHEFHRRFYEVSARRSPRVSWGQTPSQKCASPGVP